MRKYPTERNRVVKGSLALRNEEIYFLENNQTKLFVLEFLCVKKISRHSKKNKQ